MYTPLSYFNQKDYFLLKLFSLNLFLIKLLRLIKDLVYLYYP